MTTGKTLSTYLGIAVLLFGASAVLVLARSSGTGKRNIAVILLDGVRADHLSAYGYGQETSPALDQLAREAVVFDAGVSAAPSTPATAASTLSGLYPLSHGFLPSPHRADAAGRKERLDTRVNLVSEILSANGYLAQGVTADPWTSPEFGFAQGFDRYETVTPAGFAGVTDASLKVIERARENDRPFFLFAHYSDAAGNAAPAPDTARPEESPEESIATYDAGISALDREVGRLLSGLKSAGVYDDTVIVVLSDRGEALPSGDPAAGPLSQAQIRIPLILRDGSEPRRVDYTVSNIDVAPTLLAVAGIESTARFDGISLRDEAALLRRQGVLSQLTASPDMHGYISLEGKKLLVRCDAPPQGQTAEGQTGEAQPVCVRTLYDTKRDPFEQSPVENPKLLASMEQQHDALLRSLAARPATAQGSGIGKQTLDQLKSLGYLK